FIYPDGSAEAAETTKLVAVYRTSIPVGGDVYSVMAALYVLRPSVIFRSARISFIVIMIATLLTAALIVYLTAADGSDAAEGRKSGGAPSGDAADEPAGGRFAGLDSASAADGSVAARTERAMAESESGSNQEGRPAEPDVFAGGAESEAEEDADQLTWDFSAATEPADALPEAESAEQDAAAAVPDGAASVPEEAALSAAARPMQDLETPVQQEPEAAAVPSPLEERLAEALRRAEETGCDVSLLMVSVSGAPADGDVLRSVRVHLFGQFSDEGSVLEVGAGRFAVVRSGLSIDAAESVADSIQSELCGRTAGSGAKCCIGISSKSARSLPASRLVLEAEEALRHAEEDSESSVVAFHVDIEKYREYIKSV
ncbi:MAG: hypothetical protein K2H09_04200, partial [Treponemataceae bacterium]|nr:hypothetical protein [Treponemataceae bacterium]